MSLSSENDGIAHRETDSESAREQRWIKLYSDLTGASESQARACWMYVSGAQAEVQPMAVRLDDSSLRFA